MNIKSSRRGMVAAGLLAVVATGGMALFAEEVEVTLDQVPEAVRETILREAAGAKITEIERETKNGETFYEAEFMNGAQEVEIKIAPDGTVLGREVEGPEDDDDDLTIAQVPEPARSALLAAAGGSTITEVERENEGGVLVYEAAWAKNGVKHEAAVTADGNLLEVEEIIPLQQAPAAVRAVVTQQFGVGAKVVVEKKMVVLYEVSTRMNGQEHEMLVLPTGRVLEDHDDDGDDDGDDDDGGDDDDDD